MTVEGIDIQNVLGSLGISRIKDKGDYYMFSSPFRADKNPSMVCYKSSQYCRDFGGDFSGSLNWLCKTLTGKSLFQYLGIARPHLKDTEFKETLKKREEFPIGERSISIDGKIWKNIHSNDVVEKFCESRYLTDEFIQHFDIGYCYDIKVNGTRFINRLCIPVYEEGKLICIEGRDFTRKQSKKVLYPKNGTVSTLFNLSELSTEEPLVIVEGLMDISKIWTHITKNVTTTFGIQLTGRQEELINRFKHVILFPDGDDGGHRFISNLDSAYEREFDVVIEEGFDPDELSLSAMKRAFDNRIPANEWMMKNSGLLEKKNLEWV